VSERPGYRERKPADTKPSGLTRGTFVKAVGGVLLGGAALPLDLAVTSAHAMHAPGPLTVLDFESLSSRVGQTFTLTHADRRSSVRLATVSGGSRQALPHSTHHHFAATESFRAVFRASASLDLPQGTYAIRHRGSRSFSIFLVPGVGTDGTPEYSAIFNRLVK
jgi:hypothetical protein